MLLLNLLEDRWEQHEIHELWIELRSPSRRNDIGPGHCATSFSISAAVSDGVEGVGEGDDARREWDLAAAEPTGVARPVPPFVV